MNAFHGPQGPGAARARREAKRAAAEQRNSLTSWDRRSGAYWITFEDGCERGYDRDGVEHSGVVSEAHQPGAVHVPAMRSAS